MPDGPRPPDVQFDDPAADVAVTALQASLSTLTVTEPARANATTDATDGWQGAYATDFDAATGGLDQEVTGARTAMEDLIRAIRAAQNTAAQERRDVKRAQAQWDAEAEVERQHPNSPR